MNESANTSATMSIDLKKFRIRIYKASLHLLGDPKYIQVLVNPDELIVAVRAVEQELAGDQTYRVNQHQLHSDNSVEIYSRFFIKRLCSLVDGLDAGYSYRLSGIVAPTEKMLVYSLKTIKRIDGREV